MIFFEGLETQRRVGSSHDINWTPATSQEGVDSAMAKNHNWYHCFP